MNQWLIPALTLGFLGSFHCIGMCGPIALSLPFHGNNSTAKILHLLTYNLGRTLTYAAFGAVFGLIGQTFDIFGFQQYLSLTLGLVMLVAVIFTYMPFYKGKLSSKLYAHMSVIKNALMLQLKNKGALTGFNIGLLNGMLPCGLVYMALAGSLATVNFMQGALFMSVFGLSTIPVMLSISLAGNIISLQFRKNINKAVPFILTTMAVLLILRGLNLGIPYVSPKLTPSEKTDTSQTINCHK